MRTGIKREEYIILTLYKGKKLNKKLQTPYTTSVSVFLDDRVITAAAVRITCLIFVSQCLTDKTRSDRRAKVVWKRVEQAFKMSCARDNISTALLDQ